MSRILILIAAILTTSSVIAYEPSAECGTGNSSAIPRKTGEALEKQGKLEDGTDYLVRKPANWNGVVICDLDLLPGRYNGPFYKYLYQEGYGLAGTARRSPSFPFEQNLRRVREALAIFRDELGKPERVIFYGRSRGGMVALSAAELLPDEVDAAVAIAATTHLLTFNQAFDFFFILKALLAPSDSSLEYFGLTGSESELKILDEIKERWLILVNSVRYTFGGRARIALAFAMAQYPGFGGQSTRDAGVPEPDITDPFAVTDAMFEVFATELIHRLANTNRFRDAVARYIGNQGIDYSWYYENINPDYKKIVETFYELAGLEIEADIGKINNEPRVSIDPGATAEMFDHEGRTHRGTPRVPLFRMDNIADITIPTAQTGVYSDHVRRHGLEDLYRTSVVGRGGHAHCTVAEKVLSIKIVEHRLDAGEWPDTGAESLNALAASLNLGSSEFVDYRHRCFNGQWRLHSFSRNFDLSFQDIIKTVNRFESENQVTATGRDQLLELLLEAGDYYRQESWQQVKDALDIFKEMISATDLVLSQEARIELLWNMRMMLVQIASISGNQISAADIPATARNSLIINIFPNPVSGIATVQFTLDTPSPVEIGLYSTTGNKVMTIVNSNYTSGVHIKNFTTGNLPEGVYICHMALGKKSFRSKIVVLE